MKAIAIYNGIYSTGWQVNKITPKLVTGGWDTVTVDGFYFIPEGTTLAITLLQWGLGEAIFFGGLSNVWLADFDVDPVVDGYCWKTRHVYKGMLSDKPPKLEAMAGSVESEASKVWYAGAVRDKLRGTTAVPTVRAKYWVVGTPPSMTDVGTNQTPPWLAAEIIANPWIGLPAYTWIAPNGWVLTDRQIDGLPGNPPPASEVTDVFTYRLDRIPGGN